MSVHGESRAATDGLLAVLRAGRWRPRAWVSFMTRAFRRSARQAQLRPRALAEVTVIHIGLRSLAARCGHERPMWTVASWALAATHLGMLEQHRSIGWAGVLTLSRANLLTLTAAWWAPSVALASDAADGWIARHTGTDSPFGASCDALADAAFWTWYGSKREHSRPVRVAAMASWVFPVLAVTSISVGTGRMVDAPRPALLRPAAAMQAILAARAVTARLPRRDARP